MATVMRRVLEHRGGQFSRAGDLSFYFIKETALRTFEEPAAANLILAISVEGDDQAPEQLESEARQAGDRMRKATIPGRIDHGEKTVRVEIRPPGALSGASTLMGDALLEALFGQRRIVNAQAAVAIDTVESHDRTATVIDVVAAEEDFRLNDVVAIRSQFAATAGIDNQPACIANVAWPGGGQQRLTLKPALSGKPMVGDKIQGGITWWPEETWAATWSALWTQGFEGDNAEGCILPSGTLNIDGRSLCTMDLALHYKRAYFSAIGFVSGVGGVDAFLATDTTPDVDDASLYAVGSYVNLAKFIPSTGLQSGATETKAKVTARNTTAVPNTLTLTRGTSPVAQTGGPQDLTVVLPAADAVDLVAGIVVAAGAFLRIEIDHRGWIDVPLTAGAGKTATDIAADINTALTYHPLYGQAVDAPFISQPTDWSAAAANVGDKTIITSQSYGAQSQVKCILTGLAGDAFAQIWIPTATFERVADGDIQIFPWSPGGTETRVPIVNKDGICRVNGYQLLVASAAATLDNTAEHIEDVKTGNDYESGHLPGEVRSTQVAITLPAYGWTARLREMAIAAQGLFLGLVVGGDAAAGVGNTFSLFVPKAIPVAPSKSGDNRQDKTFNCIGEDPGVTVTAPVAGTVYKLADIIAGLT